MLGKRSGGVRILSDTHALIWLALASPQMGAKARTAILRALSLNRAFFSAASVWEFATLRAKKNPPFDISPRILRRDILAAGFREVPLTGDITLTGHEKLRGASSDPADYFIAATALDIGATLLTADAALLRCQKIPTMDARK